MGESAGAVVPLARAYYGLRRFDLAEPWLRRAAGLDLPPGIRAQICFMLSEICRGTNRPEEARKWGASALAIPELPPELRKRLDPR
jgi:hypothetical protein